MDSPISDDNITDPEENPTANGHLPVSGEIGGPVTYHDPATTDTNDDPEHDPALESPSNRAPGYADVADEDSLAEGIAAEEE